MYEIKKYSIPLNINTNMLFIQVVQKGAKNSVVVKTVGSLTFLVDGPPFFTSPAVSIQLYGSRILLDQRFRHIV
jgi:hypothetical protein